MSKIYNVELNLPDTATIGFKCPGCGLHHHVQVKSPRGPVWTFNGDYDAPTLSPSVRVRWSLKKGAKTCHFFVRKGIIEFCNDSTHDKAGQHIPLPVLKNRKEQF